MRIGVIGLGVVGSAVQTALMRLDHDVFGHDILLNTSIGDVLETELCFICVPTPHREDGSCNADIVKSVITDLIGREYEGLICIKSTVSPGTTKRFQEEFNNQNICFVPEFLKERSAYDDFINGHDVCVIGTGSKETYNIIKKAHGHYPKKFIMLSETEAEMCKYFNNIYNATLITFANSFYEVCKKLGVNYTNIKEAMVQREHINDCYLNCREDLRGFGGMCLPKDTKAINFLVKELGIDVDFFNSILEENDKYEVTVFSGMRK